MREELISLIVAGVLKRDFFHGGEILLHDKPVRYRVPAPAVKAGIAYVTEDRKSLGLVLIDTIKRNIPLANLPGIADEADREVRQVAG